MKKTELQKDKEHIDAIVKGLMMSFHAKHGVKFSYHIAPIIIESQNGAQKITGFNSRIDLSI